jgi:hypothetical protein
MRTTVVIDDDVLAAARSLASSEGKSLGEVLSELARRGLAPRREPGRRSGFPTFSIPEDAAPLTPEAVRRAEEDS